MANEERLNEAIQQTEQSFLAKDFAKFWASVKAVNEGLRVCRLQSENYDEIRNWLNNRCDCAKSEMAAQNEAIRNESMSKRQLVETSIRQAISETNGATTAEDLASANVLLNQASERMKDGYTHGFDTGYMFNLRSGRLTKDDREWCSQLWRGAKDGISFRRQAIHDENYQYFSGRAGYAYNEAHARNYSEAKNIVRETQGELRETSMSDVQFQAVRNNLSEAWQMAVSYQQQAHREWVQKTQDYIVRLEALVEKNEGVISRIEDQIAYCEDQKAGARTVEYANTVQGWIDEKRDKIDDIERTNNELTQKINEATNQLAR